MSSQQGEFDSSVVQSFAKREGSSVTGKVAYFYDPDIGSYYYGPGHPMKPQRMRMTHSLILSYDLYRSLEVYRPHDAIHSELEGFHDAEYVNFLADVNLENCSMYANQLRRFNLGEATDCPIFDGVFDFQASCAGASIDAALQLNHRACDIAINWSGGLHHAKRGEASGFCYFNDIVLGIIELLKYHTRVMYIDIDIHHGDGVEEAFYLSHRVMTVSFHKFGDFFPGTGDVVDVGAGAGKYYAVNVPLNDGITDENFVSLFKGIMPKCIEVFRPEAIVLQCGADSITGDRIGSFNLSTHGHAACVEYIKSFRIPLMLLGGGGYTIKNVARAWLYETAVALDQTEKISNKVPVNEYYDYFGPEHNLHLTPDPNLVDTNTETYLESIRVKIHQNLSRLSHAPSVQFSHLPPDFFNREGNKPSEADEIDQVTIEWEGGGLGFGQETGGGHVEVVEDASEHSAAPETARPTRLRHSDNEADHPGADDLDQRRNRSAIGITANMRPE